MAQIKREIEDREWAFDLAVLWINEEEDIDTARIRFLEFMESEGFPADLACQSFANATEDVELSDFDWSASDR
ncbi:hypothetical protein GFM14_36220 [Rhizobium leguminosarum bv. viciae]|uniref:hypothetical protein n=1 Tax=Rhizobium leguminosarum TaxID=384 RepID=UPI00144148EF|nr:hypothetical protein [Rhizobium leguminosarum]NKJ96891.1 hypothetical protein [Rhizobium leguminosarum bv. viciae]